MITSADEALEQNQKLVKECFKLTQKYECSEKELAEMRHIIEEQKSIISAIGDEENQEIIQKLISTMTQLRSKDKQIDEDQKKLLEMRMLLNEMTKKYCDVAKANTENSKKMKIIQEKLELKIEEKQSEVENAMSEVEAMKSAVKAKKSEIDRLKNDMVQLAPVVETQGNSSQQEIADLKNLIKKKEEEATNAQHEIHRRYVDLKKKDLMLLESQHRIDYLSQKASEWYQAFRDCQQEMHAMRKHLGASRFVQNSQFETSLIEVNQRILQLSCEVTDLKASKNAKPSDCASESESVSVSFIAEAEFMERFAKMEQDLQKLQKSVNGESFAESSENN